MTQTTEVGPIDYLVVEFPSETKSFTGAMAEELALLVDRGLVRVLDLLIIDKNIPATSRYSSTKTSTSPRSPCSAGKWPRYSPSRTSRTSRPR